MWVLCYSSCSGSTAALSMAMSMDLPQQLQGQLNMAVASSPGGGGGSPSRKTPLASYFEQRELAAQQGGAASPLGVDAANRGGPPVDGTLKPSGVSANVDGAAYSPMTSPMTAMSMLADMGVPGINASGAFSNTSNPMSSMSHGQMVGSLAMQS
eukprot:jgi/Chrzof1/9998/Cz04g23140.t1